MSDAIQWFDPSLGTPVVSVSKTGLTFNRAAVAQLGSPGFVEIGVDAKAKTLVVRGLRQEDSHESEGGPPEAEPQPGPAAGEESVPGARGLPFYRPGSRTSFIRVSSKDLIRFIKASIPDFDPVATTKYLARHEADNDYLVVDLRQPLTSRRRRKIR